MFLLAGSGLLDHRRATITWWLQGELRQRHPTIDLAADAVITVADRIVCAAGPMSWVDLLLRLMERRPDLLDEFRTLQREQKQAREAAQKPKRARRGSARSA